MSEHDLTDQEVIQEILRDFGRDDIDIIGDFTSALKRERDEFTPALARIALLLDDAVQTYAGDLPCEEEVHEFPDRYKHEIERQMMKEEVV